MKRYIYIIRHGETEYGKEKRYLGHTDCKLSKEGENQARHLARTFSDTRIKIHDIFSSDLNRCRSTISTIFPEREIIYLKELREINMGIWDGLTFEDVKNKYAEDYMKRGNNIAEFTPRDGESFSQCQKRSQSIFKYIISSTKGNIVICSHSGFIRTLICSLLKKDLSEIFSIKQSYGCINIIGIDGGNIFINGIDLNGLDSVSFEDVKSKSSNIL